MRYSDMTSIEMLRKRFGRFRFDFLPWTKESPSKIGKQARGTAYWERSPLNSGLMNKKEVRTMAGICKLCVYFRANVHPGKENPHHCAALDQALSEEQAEKVCEEQKVT